MGDNETVCEDRKDSDLRSLEKRSEEILNNFRKVKERASNLHNTLVGREAAESLPEKTAEVPPENRINKITNIVEKMGNECASLNSILSDLEEILR